MAIATDTAYYAGGSATKSFRALFAHVRHSPVMTPLNNIMYNTQTANLAQHGLHPHYQHIIVNLPQLLGPALFILLSQIPRCSGSRVKAMLKNPRLTSAATGTLILSIIPHQEPRFLIPCIPLLLTCLQLPASSTRRQCFWVSWAVFNITLSILMGVYHQGGVIPAQIAMPSIVTNSLNSSSSQANVVEVFWWKTYPPPTYLLGQSHYNPITSTPVNISTTALMGLKQFEVQQRLSENLPACQPSLIDKISGSLSIQPEQAVYLAAPLSAWRFHEHESQLSLSNFTLSLENDPGLRLDHLATFRRHINLDDMDFGDDGVWPTLQRTIGRRGLGVWKVQRICEA
jgi:phosphatidylinositol glycan class Z